MSVDDTHLLWKNGLKFFENKGIKVKLMLLKSRIQLRL
jgi:hypothetical protein